MRLVSCDPRRPRLSIFGPRGALCSLRGGRSVGAARGPRRRGRRSWTMSVSSICIRRAGPAPGARDGGHFRHRALFIGPNARAAVNEGRADYVPVFLSDVPRLFESRALPLDAVFVNATPPIVMGSARSGRVSRRCTRRPGRQDSHRPIQPLDAEDARRQLRPRRRHRSRGRGGRAAVRTPSGRSATSSKGSALRRGARSRRRHPPTRHRGDPGGDGAGARRKRDLGIHTEMFTDAVVDLVESGVITGAQGAHPRQDRDRLRHGLPAPL